VGGAVRTIGFFNNKGGVGKTSLVYHVAWMLAELGARVIAADFDPQANLTSIFLDEERLEAIWNETVRPTIFGAVSPQFRGVGDITEPHVEEVSNRIGLVVGDLELSRLEDDLSQSWPGCADGNERAFRVTSALSRALDMAAERHRADVVLLDVGPNLGALNRSALLGCDDVVVPLGADLFSLQGLRNMGPTLREWRAQWTERLKKNPDPTLRLPMGAIKPTGYIVMRHSILAGKPALAFSRWIARIPNQYQQYVLDEEPAGLTDASGDPNRFAQLKDYRSLMPLAQEARKPMFYLKPADGAFGGHQAAVRECFDDFRRLTIEIAKRSRIKL
jgi:chromosome partitioning protein